MVNIFAYGSLMFGSVRDVLINGRYKKLDAHVNGFRRLSVKGKLYPGLIESEKGRVGGLLLLGINDADLRALDRFEGNYYKRQPVAVESRSRQILQAETYVFRDEFRFLLSDEEWNADEFGKNGISTFMTQYHGFLQSR